MLNLDYVSSEGVDATRVGSAVGVKTEAGCEGGGVYRKCELFQTCKLSGSWALFQDPPAADSRCWELYYFSLSSSP